MPPRLRTRSATKNPDATLTTDDKPVSKAATVNKVGRLAYIGAAGSFTYNLQKRGKVAASDPSETVSVKKTYVLTSSSDVLLNFILRPRSRKKTELVEGKYVTRFHIRC